MDGRADGQLKTELDLRLSLTVFCLMLKISIFKWEAQIWIVRPTGSLAQCQLDFGYG